jgi:hypothetical protein
MLPRLASIAIPERALYRFASLRSAVLAEACRDICKSMMDFISGARHATCCRESRFIRAQNWLPWAPIEPVSVCCSPNSPANVRSVQMLGSIILATLRLLTLAFFAARASYVRLNLRQANPFEFLACDEEAQI